MIEGKVYDISLTIHPGMLRWPGNPPVVVDKVKAITRGDSSNISLWHIGAHTATHVDAPCHFIDGASGIDSIGPDVLLGMAHIVQLGDVRRIDQQLLEGLNIEGVTRLLLGTHNSALLKKVQFDRDYAFVTEDAARYMVELGVRLVGVDYLSIEEYHKEGRPAHHILLGAGVVVVEGLNLTGVPTGDYELLCLPLKLKDSDGAPARVLLREGQCPV